MHRFIILLTVLTLLGADEPAPRPLPPELGATVLLPNTALPEQTTLVPWEFLEIQADIAWPRVTPRFPHDFPRGSMRLEPTLSLQFTKVCMLLGSKTDTATEKAEYACFSVRTLASEGTMWRYLPQDGIALLHTTLSSSFYEFSFETCKFKTSSWFGWENHTSRHARIGARIAHFGIDSDWQSAVFPRRTEEDFVGAGPFVGLHNSHVLGDGQFQIFDDFEMVTLLGGLWHKDEGLPWGSPVGFSTSGQRSRFMMGFRARMGLHSFWDWGQTRVRFSLGYQGEVFGHYGDEIESITVRFSNNEPLIVETQKKALTDLLSHGPFLQCEFRY